MAAHAGLPFGSHIVFAYGPLGFLSVWSFYYPFTAVLSFLFLLGLQSILFAVLIDRLRNWMPLVVSFVVAYAVGTVAIATVAVQFTGGPEKILPLFFVACVGLVSRKSGSTTSRWAWIALGSALSLFCLVKVSLDLPLLGALIIVIVCMSAGERGQAMAALALGVIPVFAVGWLGTGNGLSNLYDFAHSSLSVANGYASGLSIEQPGLGATYWWAALCAGVIALFAICHCSGEARRIQIGVGLLTVLYMWDLFREGFVRHDIYHDPVYFASIPLLLLAFRPPRGNGIWMFTGIVGTTVIAVVALSVSPTQLARPNVGVRNFTHEVAALTSPSERTSIIEGAREQMEAQYQVPPDIITAIGRNSVVVEPWEQGLLWDYGLTFDPMPTFGSGYSSYLDDLDASYLTSASAPSFILRQLPVAVDGQNPTFDRPNTQLAMECDYRQAQEGASWQLLQHVSNRCGARREVAVVTAGLGQWIVVPKAPAGDVVVASFTLPLDLWWQVSNLIFKPPEVDATIDEGTAYRFEPGTASDLHVMTTSRNLGWDSDFVPGTVTRIAFSVGGQSFGTTGVRAVFYDIPLSNGNGQGNLH